MTWSSGKRESERKRIDEGMAAARRWRDEHYGRHSFMLRGPSCERCEDVGLVWWCGRPGEGGRRGPCPRCRVEAAHRFCHGLAQENFGANR